MACTNEVPAKIQPKCFCNCYNMLAWEKTFQACDIYDNKKPYFCGRCQKWFSPDDNVIVHNLIQTINVLYTLNICNTTAITKMYLTTYNIIHGKTIHCSTKESSNTSVSTNECLSSQNFENGSDKQCSSEMSNIREWLASQNPTQSNEKPHCGGKTDTNVLKSDLEDFKKYPFSCSLCDKSFMQYSQLATHHLVHIKEKLLHSCSECNSLFLCKKDLETHICRNQEIPYCCSLCRMIFPRKVNLYAHIRSHFIENSKNLYCCRACESSFVSKIDIIQHLNTHAMKSPCGICQNVYKLKCGFEFFHCVHTEGKRYGCYACNKRFSHKHSLKLHLRIHRGEKTYVCNVCQNIYMQKKELYAHYSYFPTHNESLLPDAVKDLIL